MKRLDLKKHVVEECPNTEIDCIVEGCNAKIQRLNLNQHLEKDSYAHVQLLMNRIKDLEKTNKKLMDQIKSQQRLEFEENNSIEAMHCIRQEVVKGEYREKDCFVYDFRDR